MEADEADTEDGGEEERPQLCQEDPALDQTSEDIDNESSRFFAVYIYFNSSYCITL